MSLIVAFLVCHSFSLEILVFADGSEFWKFQVTGPSSLHFSLNSSPLFTTSEDSSWGTEPPKKKNKSTKYNACQHNAFSAFFSATKLLFIDTQLIFLELVFKNNKLQGYSYNSTDPFCIVRPSAHTLNNHCRWKVVFKKLCISFCNGLASEWEQTQAI